MARQNKGGPEVEPEPEAKATPKQQYQGLDVEVLRDATKDDDGFDKARDQVVIRMQDGTEKTVLRSELTEAP